MLNHWDWRDAGGHSFVDTSCGCEAAVPPGQGKRTTHRRRALRRRAERVREVPEDQYAEREVEAPLIDIIEAEIAQAQEQEIVIMGDGIYQAALLLKAFYTWCSYITDECVEADFPGIAAISDTEAERFGDYMFNNALIVKAFNMWELAVQLQKDSEDSLVKKRIAFWNGGAVETPEAQYVKEPVEVPQLHPAYISIDLLKASYTKHSDCAVTVPQVRYEQVVKHVPRDKAQDIVVETIEERCTLRRLLGFAGGVESWTAEAACVIDFHNSPTGLGTCSDEISNPHAPRLNKVPEVQYVETAVTVPQVRYEEVVKHVSGGNVQRDEQTFERQVEVPEVTYIDIEDPEVLVATQLNYKIERAVEVPDAPYFERIVEAPYAKHTPLASDGITRSVSAEVVSDCGFAGGVESWMVEAACVIDIHNSPTGRGTCRDENSYPHAPWPNKVPEVQYVGTAVTVPQVRYEEVVKHVPRDKAQDIVFETIEESCTLRRLLDPHAQHFEKVD